MGRTVASAAHILSTSLGSWVWELVVAFRVSEVWVKGLLPEHPKGHTFWKPYRQPPEL